MKEIWASLASIMGVLAFFQALLPTIFPPTLRYALLNFVNRISNNFSRYCYFDITEIDGVNTNELYNSVQLYLCSAASTSDSTGRLSLSRSVNSSAVSFGLTHNDTLYDTFNGESVQWEHIVTQRPQQSFSWRLMPEEKRGFMLKIRKNIRPVLLPAYLDHIIDTAAEIRRQVQDRHLYTNTRGGSMDPTRPGHPWEAVPFKHPSNFDTLAMDPARKAEIIADLKEFANGETFYRATGRAWKRGYLLYGPPGTGKSSMIAAMANLLNYDIYDLEITEVGSNSELRKLLMKTTSKSIIVIEDIDCSVNLDRSVKTARKSDHRAHIGPVQEDGPVQGTVTLSGLLNFTDGLWSCCGSERIFVFTTNHVEQLDPALLRSGRMDMHVHLSYCTCQSLLILIKNYLGLEEEDLSIQLKAEFENLVDKAKLTPADASEVLIRHKRDNMVALTTLVEEMKNKVEGRKGDGLDLLVAVEEEEKRELKTTQHNVEEGGEDGDDLEEFCSKESMDEKKLK